MRAALLFGLLVAMTLAGCFGGTPADDAVVDGTDENLKIPVAPDPEVFVGTVLNDHATGSIGHFGHQLPELHAGSYNFDLLGYDDLTEGLLVPSGGFTEVHVVGDLAVVSSLTSQRGVTLVNVSNPADMKVLSHIYNLDDNWDARISEDGLYLFVGCQGSQAFDCTGVDNSGEQPALTGNGVCVPLTTCPGGIAVYDIQEPTNPAFRGYLPMGFTHNVFTYMRDANYYFVNAAGNIGEFNPEENTFQQASSEITAVHDIAVQQHPVTESWLLYTGAGSSMSIWNVDNPFAPEIIGVVEAPEGTDMPAMWHEQTPMPCMLDGRHITIGAGERGSGEPEAVAVVDTTDPAAPVYLGAWKLPDFDSLTGQRNYRFSLHNVDGNCGGQVAVGHYHAGVWVFDVSTQERQEAPVTLGYYMPHEHPVSAMWSPVATAPIGALVSMDVPNVWTAQWGKDDVLFIPDMTTGLYALQPTWETA